jgi:hypothetical protein
VRRLATTLRSANEHEHAIVALVAGAAAFALLAYAAGASHGLVRFNDFYREVAPSYVALAHGHVLDFFRLLPAYGGSVVLRTPFAILPALWGGSQRAIYFASAVPCMLADVGFCLWLAAQPRRRGSSPGSRLLPIGCCIVSPIVLIALFGGHPEEILGAVLCVAAVVAAADGRAGWAGLLAGIAVANKPWALVAVPVVVVALPAGRRRALLFSAVGASAVLLPMFAARDHGVSVVANGSGIGSIFNPTQFFWWFGHRAWIAQEARPVIIAVSIVLAVLWWARRVPQQSKAAREREALLLLALVLLLRAALDP